MELEEIPVIRKIDVVGIFSIHLFFELLSDLIIRVLKNSTIVLDEISETREIWCTPRFFQNLQSDSFLHLEIGLRLPNVNFF